MNVGKYIVSNLIGTVFIALLGLLIGFLLSLLAGLFLPESFKPYIVAAVFILFMLGVPGLWVTNWRRLKALEFLEAAEQQSDFVPSGVPVQRSESEVDERQLDTANAFDGLQWRARHRQELEVLKEQYQELYFATLTHDIKGPVTSYIEQEGVDPVSGMPRPDVLVIASMYAIFWPKVFDRNSGEFIPQPVNFTFTKGSCVHAWMDSEGFHCELIDS